MDEKQVFALFQNEKGLRMTTTYENPRQLLQVLLGVCEDLREAVAVEGVQRAMMAAAAQQRVQPVNGGVIGPNGKRLV